MIVAIHQPNYLPWLGYFAKMAQADVFVLLDEVQFSKGSYTNRVQIARNGAPVWLTLPVRHHFGASIADVEIARPDWGRAHCDALRQAYRKAVHFAEVWPDLEGWLTGANGKLAEINGHIIRLLATRLGLPTRIESSSALGIPLGAEADERLARIVAYLAPGGTYISGGGGAKYQNESVFASHGIRLAYSSFRPKPYPRSGEEFIPGLGIVDALLHTGWETTSRIVRQLD